MHCPYCKNEMKQKFLSSSRDVYLKDREAKGAMLPMWTRGSVGSKTGMTNIPVSHCETCNKVEIDLNQNR